MAIDHAESVAKFVQRGGDVGAIGRARENLHLTVIDFDRSQAGLTLEYRSCLALAKPRGSVVLTAEQAWTHLDESAGVMVDLVR